jgi:hypothetical protein
MKPKTTITLELPTELVERLSEQAELDYGDRAFIALVIEDMNLPYQVFIVEGNKMNEMINILSSQTENCWNHPDNDHWEKY